MKDRKNINCEYCRLRPSALSLRVTDFKHCNSIVLKSRYPFNINSHTRTIRDFHWPRLMTYFIPTCAIKCKWDTSYRAKHNLYARGAYVRRLIIRVSCEICFRVNWIRPYLIYRYLFHGDIFSQPFQMILLVEKQNGYSSVYPIKSH